MRTRSGGSSAYLAFPVLSKRRHGSTLKQLIEDCDGQDLVEYALLVAVVALGAVAALAAFTDILAAAWITISTNLSK